MPTPPTIFPPSTRVETWLRAFIRSQTQSLSLSGRVSGQAQVEERRKAKTKNANRIRLDRKENILENAY